MQKHRILEQKWAHPKLKLISYNAIANGSRRHTKNASAPLVRADLEITIPRIWQNRKAEVGRVREEKRSRKKIREVKGIRKDGAKKVRSRNAVFFHPEDRRCRATWWDEKWQIAHRLSAKHILKSRYQKHLSLGALLELEMFKQVRAVVGRSAFRSQNVQSKSPLYSLHFSNLFKFLLFSLLHSHHIPMLFTSLLSSLSASLLLSTSLLSSHTSTLLTSVFSSLLYSLHISTLFTHLYPPHFCILFTSVFSSHLCPPHFCILFTCLLSSHLYSLHFSNPFTPLLLSILYSLHFCTFSSIFENPYNGV